MTNVPDGTLPPDKTVAFRTFVTEKVGIYIRNQLSNFPGAADTMRAEIVKTNFESMIAQIQGWLIGGKIPSEPQYKVVQWPDGAWQMFKELHLPEWFKRKFPVRWHHEQFVIQTNHYFVCPHLVTDPQSRHVQFMATGTDFAGYGRHRPDY